MTEQSTAAPGLSVFLPAVRVDHRHAVALGRAEPYGYVTKTRTGVRNFYQHPQSPYLDNAIECVTLYATPPTKPSEQPAPEGWRVEREPNNVLALHRRGTAQPYRFEPGDVVHALLSDLIGGCSEMWRQGARAALAHPSNESVINSTQAKLTRPSTTAYTSPAATSRRN